MTKWAGSGFPPHGGGLFFCLFHYVHASLSIWYPIRISEKTKANAGKTPTHPTPQRRIIILSCALFSFFFVGFFHYEHRQ